MGLFRENEKTTLAPQDGNVWAVTSRLVTDPAQVTQISEALQARWGTYGAPSTRSGVALHLGVRARDALHGQPHGGGAIAYPGHVGGLHAGGPAHDEQHVHRRVRGERRVALFGSRGGGPTALACAWVVDGPHGSFDGECCRAVSIPLLT